MTSAMEAFTHDVQSHTLREPWHDGELVITPWQFRDGEPVIVYAKRIDDDAFIVTDRGQTTDNLESAGLDLGRENARRSWEAVRNSVSQPLRKVGADESIWELCTQADRDGLGAAISNVAEAALRADGLRWLITPPRKAREFSTWIISQAGERGMTVEPSAEIRSVAGLHRRVTAKITGRLDAYVQAVSRRQEPWEAFDRVRSLFTDTPVPLEQRFALIQDGSRLTAEQRNGIRLHSAVVDQSSAADWLDGLAA